LGRFLFISAGRFALVVIRKFSKQKACNDLRKPVSFAQHVPEGGKTVAGLWQDLEKSRVPNWN
jgi:hypothetical protein